MQLKWVYSVPECQMNCNIYIGNLLPGKFEYVCMDGIPLFSLKIKYYYMYIYA